MSPTSSLPKAKQVANRLQRSEKKLPEPVFDPAALDSSSWDRYCSPPGQAIQRVRKARGSPTLSIIRRLEAGTLVRFSVLIRSDTRNRFNCQGFSQRPSTSDRMCIIGSKGAVKERSQTA
jgi:hypothetical protein